MSTTVVFTFFYKNLSQHDVIKKQTKQCNTYIV